MVLTGLALLISGILGGVLAYRYQGAMDQMRFRWLLTFCGGLLFSTAILHLLPEVLNYGHPSENLWLLSGFFMQFILEKFSAGIEHGHFHHETNHQCDHPLHAEQPLPSHEKSKPAAIGFIKLVSKNKTPKKPWLVEARSWGLIISLSIHGLIEGVPLAGETGDHNHEEMALTPLLLGILLHKAPTTFALGALLLRQQIHSLKFWATISWVASCTPLGLWIGLSLEQTGQGNLEILHALMALATGSFLQIASTILFESSHHHKFNWLQMSGALMGAYLAYFMGH